MTEAARKDARSVDSALDAGKDVMMPSTVEGGRRCYCRIVHNDGILALNMIGELCENMLGNISHLEKNYFTLMLESVRKPWKIQLTQKSKYGS